MCVNFRAPSSVARSSSTTVATSTQTSGAARSVAAPRDGYDGGAKPWRAPFPTSVPYQGKATSSKVQTARKEVVVLAAPMKPADRASKGMVGHQIR